MKTILNRHRLVRAIARILRQLLDDFALAPPVRGDVTAAQPDVAHGSAVPRWASRPTVKQTPNQLHGPDRLRSSGSPRKSALSPASSQGAVWRPIWGLHNTERARERNPLTSAESPPAVMTFMGLHFHPKGARERGPGLRPGQAPNHGSRAMRASEYGPFEPRSRGLVFPGQSFYGWWANHASPGWQPVSTGFRKPGPIRERNYWRAALDEVALFLLAFLVLFPRGLDRLDLGYLGDRHVPPRLVSGHA